VAARITVSLVLVGIVRAAPQTWRLALDGTKDLAPHGVKVSAMMHEGKSAVRLVEEAGATAEGYAIVQGPNLQDGDIEVDVAGRPAGGASEGARGFIGVAFRVRADHSAFECFYLRPTNGRADDQLRRNHSTQYISFPDFPWQRLREQTPGVYESYVDLVTGAWTHVRVEFRARRAALYVNRAPQPVLIVNDLKLAPAAGGVGLWIGSETEGFFRDLSVVSR
jgi:hypothetical protein